MQRPRPCVSKQFAIRFVYEWLFRSNNLGTKDYRTVSADGTDAYEEIKAIILNKCSADNTWIAKASDVSQTRWSALSKMISIF